MAMTLVAANATTIWAVTVLLAQILETTDRSSSDSAFSLANPGNPSAIDTAPAYTAGQVTEEIVEESGDATLRSLDTIKQVSLRSDGSIFISCAAEAMSFCQAK